SAPTSIVHSGTLWLQTDAPLAGATVAVPFAASGWTLDQAAVSGTGIDAVHMWAFPQAGPATFLGAATMGFARADVAAIFGAQFLNSGFSLTTSVPLTPGGYTLAVFAHRTSTNTFAIVEQTAITVRGVTLSD